MHNVFKSHPHCYMYELFFFFFLFGMDSLTIHLLKDILVVPILLITNNSFTNIHGQVLCGRKLSFHMFGINDQEWDCCVIWQVYIYFLKEKLPIFHPYKQCMRNCFSESLPAFDIDTIFYFSSSHRYVVVSHCSHI